MDRRFDEQRSRPPATQHPRPRMGGQALHHPWKRGQSTTEMALVIPFLIAFLFGVVDLSRAIREQAVIANGAHVGLAYAQQVTDPNDDHKITAAEVISKTVGAAQGSVTSSNVCVLGIPPNGVCATGSSTFTNGEPITISVTTPFTTITPFIHVKSLTGSAFGGTLP
jgi:Flp pilus assembly protein TadG